MGSSLKVVNIDTRINQVVIFWFDSSFVKSIDEKTHAYFDLQCHKCVLLEEGHYIEIKIKCETPSKSITAKIAVVKPKYS